MSNENNNYLNFLGLSQFFEKLKTFFATKNELHSIKGEKGEKGDPGAAAGFGTPTATVDANVGTPSVTITTSGNNTAKVFNFSFKNLKGATGDQGPKGEAGKNATTTAVATTGTNGLMGKDMVARLNLCVSELIQPSEPTMQNVGDSWMQNY